MSNVLGHLSKSKNTNINSGILIIKRKLAGKNSKMGSYPIEW